MQKFHSIQLAIVSGLLITHTSALEIELRYDLDTEGFFDQPGAKEAMQVAADYYADLIVDKLEAIDPLNFEPGTQFNWGPTYLEPNLGGAQVTIPVGTNFVIPEDTIIVFPAGRSLTTAAQGGPGGIQFMTPSNTAWFNQLINRGEPGAVTLVGNSFSSNPTDFAPWGGSLFFNSDETWNFSTTDATAASGIDFLSVALHELGHVLGFGIPLPTTSWLTHLQSGNFTGTLATSSNNNSQPTLDAPLFHWANSLSDNRAVAVFGRQHGEAQEALMTGVTGTTASEQFIVPTDLDIAALRDLGWELTETPSELLIEVDFNTSEPAIEIPTTTGTNYQMMRSVFLDDFKPTGPEIIGDGSIQTLIDPEGLQERAFYQILTTFGSPTAALKAQSPDNQSLTPPVIFEGELPSLAPVQCQCGRRHQPVESR